MNEENLKKITDDVIQILLKKKLDYGVASFDLGLNGNMVHYTLRDIMGYAIIGLLILDDDKLNK